ncbi:hypothetical protein KI809_15645 [Geobacter pelophilus]|uniref:Uncharacterized protein n=1 Tax=Geoanaerobacter pelophilus TaxID=60036 RepID=A0AAW4L4C6_9BACT|nr:hypothetical protein [Geoanaerobacter pelophilus]MBT0665743.1 hypothetical protein [Geoanaerobacter pelophilus]
MRLIIIAILLMIAIPAQALDPGQFDITVYANEDYRLNLTHTANGVPVNLTGYSFKLQAQAKKGPGAAVLVNFSSAVTDAAAGQTSHWLSRRATAANSNAAGIYDLMQTAPDGTVTYRMRGAIKFLETVTR